PTHAGKPACVDLPHKGGGENRGGWSCAISLPPIRHNDGFREELNPSYRFAPSTGPILIEMDVEGPMRPVTPARST
ncbi:MAG: hypothetical protein ACLPKB_13965, partial [Xanthobacteraceae bacterium]